MSGLIEHPNRGPARATNGRQVKLGLSKKSVDDEHGSNEEEGFNRDVYTVTAKGALVQYAGHRDARDNFFLISSEWMKRVLHK